MHAQGTMSQLAGQPVKFLYNRNQTINEISLQYLCSVVGNRKASEL